MEDIRAEVELPKIVYQEGPHDDLLEANLQYLHRKGPFDDLPEANLQNTVIVRPERRTPKEFLKADEGVLQQKELIKQKMTWLHGSRQRKSTKINPMCQGIRIMTESRVIDHEGKAAPSQRTKATKKIRFLPGVPNPLNRPLIRRRQQSFKAMTVRERRAVLKRRSRTKRIRFLPQPLP